MIKLQNIKKDYIIKNGETTNALSNISLDIGEKGLVFILGKSGSGKTTLLNLIGGLDTSNDGSIFINGLDTNSLSQKELDVYRREHIGFIFQEHNLLSTYTISKNLALALELKGSKVEDSDIASVLKKVDLVGFKDRYPDEMSTGQKQRVAIARAIIKKPNLVIADEPTGSLDTETGKVVMELLKEISKNKLVIIVTHDVDSAYLYGDRVIEISDGIIVKDTTYKEENLLRYNNVDSVHQKTDDLFSLKSKNSLSYKDVVRVSLRNFLTKKYRLIFTLLLCTIAFTLFGVADTIANYDADKALLQSLNEVDRRYVTLSKEMVLFDNETQEYYGENPSFTLEEIASLRDSHNENNFYSVFFNYNDYFGSEVDKVKVYEYEKSYGWLFNFEIAGSTEISQGFLDDTGTTLVAGRLPEKNINDNEIVISEYLFETFKKFNLKEHDGYVEITSYDDILGRTFYDFEVVGVINTNFNFERYSILDENPNIDSDFMRNISFELDNLLDCGIHNLLFFRDGYYEEVLDNQDVVLLGNLRLKNTQSNGNLLIGDVNSVTTLDNLSKEVFTNNNVQFTSLEKNEIIVPIDMLPKFGEPGITVFNTYESINDKITSEINVLIAEFVVVNFELIELEYESDFGESTYNDYMEYILSNDLNAYQEDYNIEYFTNLARREVLNINFFDNLSEYVSGDFDSFGYLSENAEFEVVGVYFPDNPKVDIDDNRLMDNPVIISDEMKEHIDDDIGMLITTISDTFNENLEIIDEGKKEIDEHFIGVDYILNSEYKTMINYAGGYISFTSTILVAVGGLFAVFSSLLLFNFISSSIRLKQKDIGILRSMGASSFDVFKIFCIESLLIGIVCFVFSLILTTPIVIIFDNVLQSQFSVPVSFVFVTFRQVALLFVISTLVSLLATIVPIYNFSRKRPIDIIKKAVML